MQPGPGKDVGGSDIFEAVAAGDLDALRQTLSANPQSISSRGIQGISPLHLAAVRCNEAAGRILLDAGADVHAKKDDGWTPLHNACQNGDVAMVRLLLEHGADPSHRSKGGQTPLHSAAYGVSDNTIRMLENEWAVGGRADPPRLDHGEVVGLLISGGAEIDATEPTHGATPLFLAIFRENRNAARVLIERGADLAAESKGWTALQLAAGRCDEELVRLLLASGADVTAPGVDGKTPRESIGMVCQPPDAALTGRLKKMLTPSRSDAAPVEEIALDEPEAPGEEGPAIPIPVPKIERPADDPGSGRKPDEPDTPATSPDSSMKPKHEPKSDCFIATAACGSPQAKDVIRLRAFRDHVLKRWPLGRRLIRLYETLSPPIAHRIRQSAIARLAVRRLVVGPLRCMAEVFLPEESEEVGK